MSLSRYEQQALEQLTAAADVMEGHMETSNTMQVLRAIRDELGMLHMNPSYRDQFVAAVNIEINQGHSPEAVVEYIIQIRRIVRAYYLTMSKEGLNDQAIALSAQRIKLEL